MQTITVGLHPEYIRKTAVAAHMADSAWLRGGLDAMHDDLCSLRRQDADAVVVGEFERLYHRQCIRVL